ncbi:MAG: C40 family peptidase [Clostridia bacterium]|nr:C40 family peptidase [Clostridia bacterium]
MKFLKNTLALLLALSFLTPSVALLSGSEQANNNELFTPPLGTESTLPENGGDNSGENGNTSETPEIIEPSPTPTPEPEPEPEPEPPKISYAQYIRCTGDSVNIRSGAGTGFATLGQAEKGENYAVVGKSGSWYQTYYRGKTAYIYASYAAVLSIAQSDNTEIERVIKEGYKLIGVPYVYGAVRLHDGKGKLLGGFSAQKFDCLSLIQYVFYKGAGELLQVNTRTQVKQGKHVPKSELKRGDCIFFTNASRKHLSGIERIGHVALYLGDNYILHTASDYARIEKISSTRWGYYVEARRFI